jgi:HK97 family phage major capsid protein
MSNRTIDLAGVFQRKATGGPAKRGPEDDYTQQQADACDLSPRGWFIPRSAFPRRTLSAGSGSGANLVADDYKPGVREPSADLVLERLGVRMEPGQRGNAKIPRLTSTVSPEYVDEGSAASESTVTIEQIEGTPHVLTTNFLMSAKLRNQGGDYINTVIAPDFRAALDAARQRAVLHGTGSGGEPTGLASTTGVSVVGAGTNGGAPSVPLLASAVQAVTDSGASLKSPAFLSTPAATAAMLRTPKFASGDGGAMLDNSADVLLGYPYRQSTIVRDDLSKGDGTGLSGLFFGDWSDLMVVSWGDGAVEVTFDPYTYAPQGLIRVTATQYFDVVVLRPSSFACVLDLATL